MMQMIFWNVKGFGFALKDWNGNVPIPVKLTTQLIAANDEGEKYAPPRSTTGPKIRSA